MPTAEQVVRDLQWLANETALAHRVVKQEYPDDRHPWLLEFLEKTYIHNQRRLWEKEQVAKLRNLL